MKKAFYIVLALILALSLAGCGNSDADRSDNTKDGVIGDGLDGLNRDLDDVGRDIGGAMDDVGRDIRGAVDDITRGGSDTRNNTNGTNGTMGTNGTTNGANGANGTYGTNGGVNTNGTVGSNSGPLGGLYGTTGYQRPFGAGFSMAR